MENSKQAEAYQHSSESTPQTPPPAYRPPLPPRSSSPDLLSPNIDTDRTPFYSQSTTLSWSAQDPRSSSTQSLVPVDSARGKRTLFLIYIHGFLGDETSFQSFPAHVHNVVTPLLQETHVVHTKLYPKYRSRNSIQVARDNFGKWLAPHESADTDFILCGHSMGGLLSAEIVLDPSESPGAPFRHRILGTINFDVPFLGMHPGVVWSGIGSLFRPAPKSPAQSPTGQVAPPGSGWGDSQSSASGSQSISTLALPTQDPNYDPPFPEDVRLPTRKGWESALHFITKHSDGLRTATKSYVSSHLEFGGTMADYKKLYARYKALRALEDVDEQDNDSYQTPRRVRFVNYYTASTGVRKPSPARKSADDKSPTRSADQQGLTTGISGSPSASPRTSIEQVDGAVKTEGIEESGEAEATSEGDMSDDDHSGSMSLKSVEPIPHDDTEPETQSPPTSPITEAVPSSTSAPPPPTSPPPEPPTDTTSQSLSKAATTTSTQADAESLTPSALSLPDLPPLPAAPADFDPSAYDDKAARKDAERAYATEMKAYKQALKDREKAIKERSRLLEKHEKQVQRAKDKQTQDAERKVKQSQKDKDKQAKLEQKEHDKRLKDEQRQLAKEAKEQEKATAAATAAAVAASEGSLASEPGAVPSRGRSTDDNSKSKKPREGKFCLLPPKTNGVRDPAWLRVFMPDVDEVGAHCGLFDAARPHYEGWVRDVGDLVATWVARDIAVRDRPEGQGRGSMVRGTVERED